MHSCRIAIRKDFIKTDRKAPVMETFFVTPQSQICNATQRDLHRRRYVKVVTLRINALIEFFISRLLLGEIV